MPDAHDVLNMDEDEEELEFVDPERSCNNCTKQNTCAIYQQVGEIVHPEAWRGCDEPPIHLPDLAVMCDDFSPEGE